MCVIVVQPARKYLTKELAKQCWLKNPDGAGFSYYNEAGEEHTFKSMNFEDFWREFERARSDNRDTPFLLHFRIATHGSINIDNVHPFTAPNIGVFAHNGVIHGVPDHKDGRSDTRVFADEVLSTLPERWWENKYLVDMMQNWIGWSKLAFLSPEGYMLMNEDKGVWHDGMWFSNNGPLPTKWSKPTTNTAKPVVAPSTEQTVDQKQLAKAYRNYYDWDFDDYTQSKGAESKYGNVYGFTDGELIPDRHNPSYKNKQKMEELRMELNLWHGLEYDYTENTLWCLGCYEELQDDTGNCSCYDMVDKGCMEFAADCECIEKSLVPLEEVIDHAYPTLAAIERSV